MHDGGGCGEFAPSRENRAVPSGHDRDTTGCTSRRARPKTTAQRIVVRGRGSDPGDPGAGIRHVRMFAMNAGTSRAVLISEDSDDNVAQVEELLVCRGV